jgi:hypothetical protein
VARLKACVGTWPKKTCVSFDHVDIGEGAMIRWANLEVL